VITAEVLPASSGLDALRGAWDRLYLEREGEREPSVSFGWSRAILRNHLADRSDWFTLVLRRGEDVRAIVPMTATREKMFGAGVVTLQPVQEKNNTHSDLLIGAERELIGAWLDGLYRLDRPWDMLHMSRLLEDSPLLAALEAELRQRDGLYRLRLEQPSFHLRLPGDYEQYLASRSGKFRNYLKRAERRLQAAGHVEFQVVDAAADFDACYEQMLAVERDSWKHGHGTAISVVAHQSGFYRDLCMSARESGTLHLSFLRLDGHAVAYNLGVIAGGRYYYLKTSYSQAHREYGVATVGRARLIHDLISRGVAEFDFPAEPYEWETQWTDGARWHRSLLLFNRGFKGRLLWLLCALRERLRGVRTRRIQFSDARALRPES
jgi:CelD/BcsL family acetyltransferase involved in cellulose biosynthesis